MPLPVSGIGPFIQQRRMPFFSSMVVMVPVVMWRSVSNRAALIVRLPFRKSFRTQPAGGTVAAAIAPVVPLRAVAEIAGVRLLDQQVDERLSAKLVRERERRRLVDPHQRRMDDEPPIHAEVERNLHAP